MRSWLARRYYDMMCGAAFTAFTFGFSFRATGRHNLPRSGPALLVSNHQSYLDPLLIGTAAPYRYLTFLARESLFKNRLLRCLIATGGGIPIDNRGLGKAGLQATLKALDRGEAVLVFPEGHRSYTGAMQPFEAGVSLLIKRVKAPIVPVGVAGVYDAWSRHQKLPKLAPLFCAPRPGTVAVAFGKPIDPTPFASMEREEMLQQLFVEVSKCAQEAERIRRKPQ
jgi:1-acyl-sn-glycerol-3-phosphate acyltransferase